MVVTVKRVTANRRLMWYPRILQNVSPNTHCPLTRVTTNTGKTVKARIRFAKDKFKTNKLGIVRSCLLRNTTNIITMFSRDAETNRRDAKDTSRVICVMDLTSNGGRLSFILCCLLSSLSRELQHLQIDVSPALRVVHSSFWSAL